MSNEFSWERYKSGEKVTTRDGCEVLNIEKCNDGCKCFSPIHYTSRDDNGCLNFECTNLNGKCIYYDDDESGSDLIMAPRIMDLYICIEKDSKNILEDCTTYDTTPACTKKMTLVNSHLFKQVKITVNTDTWEQVL